MNDSNHELCIMSQKELCATGLNFEALKQQQTQQTTTKKNTATNNPNSLLTTHLATTL